MADDRETEKVTPTEAIAAVLDPLHKALDRTMLLQPSEPNNQAVANLLECHTSIAESIPGAQDKIIPADLVSRTIQAKTISETAAYKNQIRQGQTLFAAPEEPNSLEDTSSPNNYTKR